jgi:hypothetical protein
MVRRRARCRVPSGRGTARSTRRLAVALDPEVDFGGEAASAPPKRLGFRVPPLARPPAGAPGRRCCQGSAASSRAAPRRRPAAATQTGCDLKPRPVARGGGTGRSRSHCSSLSSLLSLRRRARCHKVCGHARARRQTGPQPSRHADFGCARGAPERRMAGRARLGEQDPGGSRADVGGCRPPPVALLVRRPPPPRGAAGRSRRCRCRSG